MQLKQIHTLLQWERGAYLILTLQLSFSSLHPTWKGRFSRLLHLFHFHFVGQITVAIPSSQIGAVNLTTQYPSLYMCLFHLYVETKKEEQKSKGSKSIVGIKCLKKVDPDTEIGDWRRNRSMRRLSRILKKGK